MIQSMDTKYAYAVARIRAVEQRMLSRSVLERMIEADSAEEAFKVLRDANYGFSAGESTAYNYEQILSEELEKVYNLLMEIAPNPDAFDLFFIKNDYHNLKVHLKAELSNQEVYEHYLAAPSLYSADAVADMFRNRDFSQLPESMQAAVNACFEAFSRTADPQLIDIILDQALYSDLLKLAQKLGNPFVRRIVVIMIDTANLKIVLRTKLINKDWEFLERFLIPGGSFEFEFYQKLLELDFDQFPAEYADTAYSQLLEESMKSFKSSRNLAGFEMLCDNYLMDLLKETKFAIFGIEPLVTYLLAKELEIKNVRIVMVGKINQLAQDVIRERLRETYV
jgi:V/A-type H+-transporting ATPase subunit C